jgi:hypothetical protein
MGISSANPLPVKASHGATRMFCKRIADGFIAFGKVVTRSLKVLHGSAQRALMHPIDSAECNFARLETTSSASSRHNSFCTSMVAVR